MADPVWSNVALLLHCDGTDGSTNVVDSSSYSNAVTVGAQAQIDTTNVKYGTGSLRFPDYAGYVETTIGKALGTGDWCIEVWIYSESRVNGNFIFNTIPADSTYETAIGLDNSGYPFFRFYDYTWAQARSAYCSGFVPLNTWVHIAVVKSGTTIQCYVNGQTDAALGSCDFNDTSTDVGFWGWANSGDNTISLDDIRVVVGEPVYTAAFTPPTEAHPYGGTTGLYNDVILGWNVSRPAETIFSFSDESSLSASWGSIDGVSFYTVLESLLQSNQSVIDSVVFADVIRNAYPISVTNTVTLTTDSVRTIRLAMTIVTTLRMLNPTGSAAQQTTFMHNVATSLVLRSLVGTARIFGELTDIAELVDTVNAVIRAVDVALSELVVEADSVLYFRILTNAESIVALVDELSQSTAVYNEVGDTILFVGAIGLDNEDYTVWAVHPSYPAATEYDNFEFNSFAKAGGKHLAASRDGIYELGGSSDAGADIAAIVRTGLFDFGATQLKQVTRAYLGYTSDNRLVLKTIATDGGQKTERWYELQDKTADDIRESRIKLGKGVKSRYWQFELINVDGGQFEIDQLHLMPLMLSRRVKE